MYKIKITLKSDLCAASGDGFSTAVDTDVCYDTCGFPYIPARRIKGCLREAAEYIESENINEIFGVSGSERCGSLKLSNAVIDKYNELYDEAQSDASISPAYILNLFTTTKSATAIENDTAKDNSLRFTRAVDRLSPFDGNELSFYSDVELDAKHEQTFSDICKALRNIGYKRNRGFGAVRCELIKSDENKKDFKAYTFDDDKEYEINYTIKLVDMLMLPSSSSVTSADYISGVSVLGAFASMYLNTGRAACSDFDDLFLKNNVVFTNLYIKSQYGEDTFPAPAVIGKIKGKDEVVNLLGYRGSEIVKPFKNGYVDKSINTVKISSETVYHHTNRNEQLLYTQDCISKGQLFSGSIKGKGKYISVIYGLLFMNSLRFGRSKTAQYSKVDVVNIEVSEQKQETVKIDKGDTYALVALSDTLILNDCGNYSLELSDLCKALSITSTPSEKTSLRYKTVTGFNAKQGLQRAHIRAFAAGSVITFTATESTELPKYITVGERRNEGCGIFRTMKSSEFDAREKSAVTGSSEYNNTILTQLINENVKRESMRAEAIRFFKEKSSTFKTLNAAFIGRLTLMTKQANSYIDLKARFDSIKSKSKCSAANSILTRSEAQKYDENYWRDYILIILTLAKYSKKEKGE